MVICANSVLSEDYSRSTKAVRKVTSAWSKVRSKVLSKKRPTKISEKPKKKRIIFDVSGMRYEAYEETLAYFPNTLLGNPARRNEYLDTSSVSLKIKKGLVSERKKSTKQKNGNFRL